jgi:alpha-beta hydrolase superfamily lysophospholipase
VQPDYAAALRRYEALARRDDETIHARGGTILLGHGRPTARAVVLLHGLTASPSQCAELARRLHESGDTVLVPRLPGHGARDRLTRQLSDVRAGELIDAAQESLAIARGLGTAVTVAGFSLGGLLAAWLAQHESIHHVVAIAPFLGVARLHPRATPAFAAALRALPNVFLWWNPILRERLMPDHGYPRFPTRAIAEALGIANALAAHARISPPATRRITIVTNSSETAVNNDAARALADAWRAHDAGEVALAHIIGLPPSHDVIEPLRPGTHARRAYRTLLPILHDARR